MKSHNRYGEIAQQSVNPAETGHNVGSLCESDIFALLQYLHDDSQCVDFYHSFKSTTAFLSCCFLPIEPTLSWFRRQSSRCDCEVINKFAPHWRNRRFLDQIVSRLPKNVGYVRR